MKFHKTTKYYGWWFNSKHLKIWDDGFTLFGFHLGWIHPWCHDAKAFGHPHRVYINIPQVGHWTIGLPSRRDQYCYEEDGRDMVDLYARVPWHIAGCGKWSESQQKYINRWITYRRPHKKVSK